MCESSPQCVSDPVGPALDRGSGRGRVTSPPPVTDWCDAVKRCPCLYRRGFGRVGVDAADLVEKSEAEGRKLRRASSLSRSLIDGGRVYSWRRNSERFASAGARMGLRMRSKSWREVVGWIASLRDVTINATASTIVERMSRRPCLVIRPP